MGWHYRRENLKGDDRSGLVEGEATDIYFRVKEILAYLPPWESFCHEKCGFYQDFYLVKWDEPFSEVDYSKSPNGCATHVGATWEPDECLPAHLDPLRIEAKRKWIEGHKEEGNPKKSENKRPAPSSEEDGKKQRLDATEVESKAPVQKKKLKRDGLPLDQDMIGHELGHDFTERGVSAIAGVRTGWPKTPAEYPKGYGVANPPVFCWAQCDCMDDQRAQQPWETCKPWIEDKERAKAADACVAQFSQESNFVIRRGQVSNMCFFETDQEILPDQTHSNACLDLAASLSRRVQEVVSAMPLQQLYVQSDCRVAIPAVAFLTEDLDVEPLYFKGVGKNGGELPHWLRINTETGEVWATSRPLVDEFDFGVEFHHSEGVIGSAPCRVMGENTCAWQSTTDIIMARFNNTEQCPIEESVRWVLQERLDSIYDFDMKRPREVSLAIWVNSVSKVIRMLRSSAIAVLTQKYSEQQQHWGEKQHGYYKNWRKRW